MRERNRANTEIKRPRRNSKKNYPLFQISSIGQHSPTTWFLRASNLLSFSASMWRAPFLFVSSSSRILSSRSRSFFSFCSRRFCAFDFLPPAREGKRVTNYYVVVPLVAFRWHSYEHTHVCVCVCMCMCMCVCVCVCVCLYLLLWMNTKQGARNPHHYNNNYCKYNYY